MPFIVLSLFVFVTAALMISHIWAMKPQDKKVTKTAALLFVPSFLWLAAACWLRGSNDYYVMDLDLKIDADGSCYETFVDQNQIEQVATLRFGKILPEGSKILCSRRASWSLGVSFEETPHYQATTNLNQRLP